MEGAGQAPGQVTQGRNVPATRPHYSFGYLIVCLLGSYLDEVRQGHSASPVPLSPACPTGGVCCDLEQEGLTLPDIDGKFQGTVAPWGAAQDSPGTRPWEGNPEFSEAPLASLSTGGENWQHVQPFIVSREVMGAVFS